VATELQLLYWFFRFLIIQCYACDFFLRLALASDILSESEALLSGMRRCLLLAIRCLLLRAQDPRGKPTSTRYKRSYRLVTIGAAVLWPMIGTGASSANERPRFATQIYPLLYNAGCRFCHNPNGVASATRLHFPEEGASKAILDSFGESLVEFVDRSHAEQSLLFNKPTNRIKHSGGERIKKNSPEEALLKQWITYLASMPDSDVRRALLYRGGESSRAGPSQKVMLRRMTHQQYANTVRDLLGESYDPSSQFPPEDFVDGFKNQYRSQSLSPVQVEAYGLAAERLAGRAFLRGDSRHLIPCDYTGTATGPCRSEFVKAFGRRAFRRPLNAQELAMYEGIFGKEGDFLAGARAVIESMLQAPAFLFWMENAPRSEWKPYAAASRLSYSLWNTMPDQPLLDCAAKGDLNDKTGIERAARRMLADPRAKPALDEFASQWLRFDRLLAAARERRTFPMFSRELVLSMIEESKHFVADLVWNDANFMDIFRVSRGYVNVDLATLYKVPVPAHDFDAITFPADQERSGVLGQALFLTLTSKPEDTAPTSRGLFVREQFLCQQVPPPPPGVDTNLPAVSENQPVTNRVRLASHTVNQSCSSCHSLIDPIGFGLEKFDAIGARREKARLLFYPDVHEAKIPKKEVLLNLDTTGRIAGVDNSDFSNPTQMGQILAGARQCQECVVKQLFRYLAGRHETPADAPRISDALSDFEKSGFRFRELMISLVMSLQEN